MSLLTALLLMTIVGMGIVIVQLWREVGPMRREVVALRSQVGVLTIDDDKQIQVVQVREPGGFRWNWRIWLPKGHDYWFCASRSVPDKGSNSRQFESFIGVGGQEVNLRIEVLPSENGKRYVYVNRTPFFEVEDAKWVNGDAMIGEDVTGQESQVSSNVDDPLVLLRLYEADGTAPTTNGLLLWISNQRKP